jgi:hypothetical protein
MFSELIVCVVLHGLVTDAYLDVTIFNSRALVSLTGACYIGGYSSGDAVRTVGNAFTIQRVLNTGTGDEMPSGVETHNNYHTRLTFATGSGLPGVYSYTAAGVELQTVVIAANADIHPESHTKTVSWGDDVTLTMTIQKPSTSTSQLRWKHNSADKTEWNGLSSITVASAKPSDGGVYECYTTQQQRQDGLNGLMILIVRGCPNGKWGSDCLNKCIRCFNGAVCHAETGECICPPGFTGINCEEGCGQGNWGYDCVLACSRSNVHACRSRMMCVLDPMDVPV